MPYVTTDGLVDTPTAATTLPEVQWAVAAGSADVITAAYATPNTALTDGLILGFRASAANATGTPSFAPDGLTAHPITKGGGLVLRPGDIASGGEPLVRYNLANTRWELLNPYTTGLSSGSFAIATGTSDAIAGAFVPARLVLDDGTLLRVRATAANTTATPTFSPDGLTVHTIVRADGSALRPGDIVSGLDMLLEYDLANTRWKLLNAATSALYFKALVADDTGGTNVNTAQPWFPTAGSVALAVGTYFFEGLLFLSRSAGTTSHTTGILFGGTATLGVISYRGMAKTGDANDLQSWSGFEAVAATSLVVKAASTSATEQTLIRIDGILTVTVAGTLIPQFIYSAAPGGAPTVKTGTYFSITQRVNPIGVWA